MLLRCMHSEYVIQPANLTDKATVIITNLESISVKEWSDAQRSDAAWAPWFDYFEQQRLPTDKTIRAAMIREAAHFTLTQCSDGTSVLQHRSQHITNGESLRLVVPSGMRRRVLQHSHSTKWNGHVGPSKTVYTIRLSFWWPTLLVDCTSYCRSCIGCQQRKRPWSKQQPVLHWPVNRPFQRLAMDLLDLKTISINGSRYVMVVTEYWTKWKYLFALSEKDPIQVAQCSAKVITDHGAPEELLSDFGGEFVNAVNTALVERFSISRLRTTPYHPQTDGMVERSNSVVLEMLHHGLTPFFMLYGREARLPDCFMQPVEELCNNAAAGVNSSLYVEGLLKKLLHIRAKILEAQAKRGVAYSKHNSELRCHQYMVGDKVMVYRAPTGKLESRYEGPWQVVEDINGGGVTFKLKRTEQNKPVTITRHASLFKPYMDRPSWMEVDDVFTNEVNNDVNTAADATSESNKEHNCNEQTIAVEQQSVPQLQPDEQFLLWLQARQSELGTPKADLIAITDAMPVGKHNMYKPRFAGRKEITGWVPQFVVLQYWSKQKLDAWNSTHTATTSDTTPSMIESALAEYPIGTKVAKMFKVNKGQKWFAGHVIGYAPIKKWFRVEYTDGDREEMSRTELRKSISDFQQQFVTRRQRS
jgi:Integrase zinc binding domain